MPVVDTSGAVHKTPRVRGGKGHLLIDNRSSGGELIEMDTLTCVHCNSVVVLNPKRTRPRNFCRKCNAYACDNKICATECHPIVQSVELALKHSDSGQAFLPRGPQGEILFDPALAERERIFLSGSV